MNTILAHYGIASFLFTYYLLLIKIFHLSTSFCFKILLMFSPFATLALILARNCSSFSFRTGAEFVLLYSSNLLLYSAWIFASISSLNCSMVGAWLVVVEVVNLSVVGVGSTAFSGLVVGLGVSASAGFSAFFISANALRFVSEGTV